MRVTSDVMADGHTTIRTVRKLGIRAVWVCEVDACDRCAVGAHA